MSAHRGLWARYVDFWRELEAPEALALGRITFGLAVVANVLEQLLNSGVIELYAPPALGGVFSLRDASPFSLFAYLPTTPTVIYTLVFANLLAGVTLTLGLFSRASALALMILHVALVERLGMYNFSSDGVFRVFSFLMLLAPSGAAYSLDKRWRGKGATRIPAWPRRLLIAQLTIIYVTTGVMKAGSTWSFADGWSALYYALNLPYFARWSGALLASPLLYPLTQVGTFVTRWWESLFFLVPLSLYWRARPPQRGPVRRLLARLDLRWPFLAVGAVLHLSLVVVMKLGMFPWVMLSLYPFCMTPDEARRFVAWLRRRAPQSRSTVESQAVTKA